MRYAPYRLALRTPVRTSRGELRERTGFQVWIGEGRGEAAPLQEHGTETQAECERALSAAVPRIRPVDHIEQLDVLLDGLPPAARCGIELALLDDLALRRGISVARLLDSASRDEVRVSALLTGVDPAALAREARSLTQEGFGTLKLKVAHRSLDEDLARTAVVRDAAGPEARIRVDANGGWSEAEALDALRRLARLDLELCEQPVADVAAMGRLRGATPVRIAADELLADPRSRQAAIEASDLLILKPMVLGGLLPALRLARGAGVPAIVTTTLDGAIARLGAAHLAAALPPGPDAGLATGRLLASDLCADPAAPVGGRIRLPPRAGLGLP
jgi:o-succinylbenzoate synthase